MFKLLKHTPFGLDISDLSVKIAQLKNEKGSLVLANYGRQEIPEGIILNGEIKDAPKFVQVLKEVVANVKGLAIKTDHCAVSLPETESFLQLVQLPKMKESELAEAIKWEASNYFPLPIESLYYDWQIVKPLEETGGKYSVLIGALSKKLVDSYLDVLEAAGLEPVVLEIESIATARSLIENQLTRQPVMLIDLGAKRSSFIIFSGRTIHFTASGPISNEYLIDEIAKRLKVDKKTAKKLKFEVGLDKSKEDGRVFDALVPGLNELILQTKKYMDFFASHGPAGHFENPEFAKIILCGGGANLTGLPAFFSKELQLSVEMGNPWVNILESSPEEIPELPYEQSIGYATVLGLALRAIETKDI